MFPPVRPAPAAAPYAAGSGTSRAAALAIAPQAGALRALTLRWVRDAGQAGSTCDEIETRFGLRHQTASARIWELHRKVLIADSGMTRPTRSGRMAVVWVVPVDNSNKGENDER